MDELTRAAGGDGDERPDAAGPGMPAVPDVAGETDAASVGEPADPRVPAMPRISSRAAGTILGLSEDLLPALIARLDASALGELEVRTDAWRVRLRKAYDRRRPVIAGDGRRRRTSDRGDPDAHPGHDAAAEPRREEPRTAGAGHGTRGGAHAGPAQAASAESGEAGVPEPAMATSPAVGYFSPRDGWGPGRHVRSGDVVGYVDCLGVRQEVLSPVDGFLGRLLAQPGEAVEYGQPLLHVDLPAPAAAASPAASEAASEAAPQRTPEHAPQRTPERAPQHTPQRTPQRTTAGGEG